MSFLRNEDKYPRVNVGIDCGESMTKQSHKKECDINFIMAKYQKTGIINFRKNNEGAYLDATEYPVDFQEAMDTVQRAQELFDQMPSSLRKEFQNDPGVFLDFAHNPANTDRLVELGLANAPIEITPPEPPQAPSEPPQGEKP